ncbi:sugar O-acetyltransferase [Porphyromonadaceae bacterium]
MLLGQLYNPGDPDLMARWHKAKELMRAYNSTPTTDFDRLNTILTELLGGKGENCLIAAPFTVDYGDNIFIGNNVEINFNCVILDCARITIGDNVLIAPNVQIYAATHPVVASDRLPDTTDGGFAFCKSFSAPVIIGNNVWIGGGSILLPGVTIGDNTTIGAGSVVTRSIPNNVLAVGNPCRVIRQLE